MVEYFLYFGILHSTTARMAFSPNMLFLPFQVNTTHQHRPNPLSISFPFQPHNKNHSSVHFYFNSSCSSSNKSSLTPISCQALARSKIANLETQDLQEYHNLEEEEEEEEEEEDQEHEKMKQRLLSDCWREIHGRDDWAGLLDPIDPLLRSQLIRYGEMAQACYDAFDYDPFSKYCGTCRYTPRNFFTSLNMPMGYNVSRYLYATTNINLPNFFKKSIQSSNNMWSPKANWIGYISVSDDQTSARLGRRDIAVAWRGTVTQLEWLADLTSWTISDPSPTR